MFITKSFLFILIHVFLISGTICFSQNNYNRDYFELFFGRQPSARSEAMGRSFAAMTEDVNSYFYNPAGLATVDGLNLNVTYAKPFYLAFKGNYNFIGVSYKIKQFGVLALSRDYFGLGEVDVVNEFGVFQHRIKPSLVNFRLTLSREMLPNFYAGVNFNLFRDKEYSAFLIENRTKSFFYADLGVLKIFNIKGSGLNHKINIGSSIINLNYTSYEMDLGNEVHRFNLPVIFRIGAAYDLKINGSPVISNFTNYNFLLLTEYQNTLNAKRNYEIKSGFELSLFELLSLRMGYYYQKESECDNCKNHLNEFTYGLGINIPIHKFLKTKFPLNIKFDYANLKQPSFVTDRNNRGNFQVYNLKINWLLK